MSIRDEWINRPAHLRHLSLVEYVTGEKGIPLPLVPTISKDSRPRHAPGEMNGMEKKYAAYLDIRKVTGEIKDWKFEPLKLRLAPKTYYTPDFLLLMPDGRIELHETKGFMEEDAAVKIKVAREMFAEIFTIVLVRMDKNKQWTFK
jgi:hypothetical protein